MIEIINIYTQPPLTKGEEYKLIEQAQKGELDSIDKLICSNINFIYSKFAKFASAKVPLAEILSAGLCGIHEAISRFDLNKNVRFISFAYFYAKKEITPLLYQAEGLDIPITFQKPFLKIQNYLNTTFSEASPEEVAQATKVNLPKVKKIIKHIQSTPLEDLEYNYADPYQETLKLEELNIIDSALESLTDKQRQVIEMRFGLDDGKIKTLQEIGDLFGVSYEAVRLMQNRALIKIRNCFDY